jgi:broad specificity phosphatase PhoE
MTKLILTRHDHVEGIEPKRFRERADLPLTELGRTQAKAVACRVAALWTPVAIYTSPMGRCVSTADAIAEACQVERHVLGDLSATGLPCRRVSLGLMRSLTSPSSSAKSASLRGKRQNELFADRDCTNSRIIGRSGGSAMVIPNSSPMMSWIAESIGSSSST